MRTILNFDHDKVWFELFAEKAIDGSLQHFLTELIREIDEEILETNPGNNPDAFHRTSIRMWAQREQLQQMFDFFNKMKDEFERRAREG